MPCSRAATRIPLVPKIDSTRSMCKSKKSISGHLVCESSCRTSSTAAVEKAKGVTGPAAAVSKTFTTRRASSIVEMNGMRRRSNRRSGNWIRSAFPMVSAVIPVLSERKKTGIGGDSDVSCNRSSSSPTSHHLRRSAHRHRLYQCRDWYHPQPHELALGLITSCLDRLFRLSAPGQQLIDWPRVDYSSWIEAQVFGSLTAIDLELQLSGHMSVRVDGEEASHLYGRLQQTGRWVASLRTG